MNCPKCNAARLHPLQLAEDLGAWSCESCNGIWIPAGKAIGAQPPGGLVVDEERGVDSDKKAGICPEGHGILMRAQTHLEDGFYLERCNSCFGVWFDKGEWQRVAAAGLAGGLFEVWTQPWQRTRRKQEAARAYDRQLNDELGGDLVAEISTLAEKIRTHESKELAISYFLREYSGR